MNKTGIMSKYYVRCSFQLGFDLWSSAYWCCSHSVPGVKQYIGLSHSFQAQRASQRGLNPLDTLLLVIECRPVSMAAAASIRVFTKQAWLCQRDSGVMSTRSEQGYRRKAPWGDFSSLTRWSGHGCVITPRNTISTPLVEIILAFRDNARFLKKKNGTA